MKKFIFCLIFILFIRTYCHAQDIPNLIKKVISGVVLVQSENSLGSGVIVSDGCILTNYHVVSEANLYDYEITIKTHDKEIFVAKIVSFDEDLDLCLLKTEVLSNVFIFPIVHPDSVKVGEDVICIGNPFGISDYVTKGIISKYNTPYIFTTASINPGNSGGAMINIKGELIGIPSMNRENAQNFNIAICPRSIRYFLTKNKIKFKSLF